MLAWVVDLAAVNHRHHAVGAFGTQSEPLVVTAQRIQTELEQADARAANAFLAGGLEPADQRAAYEQSIAAGATDLADAAREVGLNGSGVTAVHTIATELGVYTGLIEQARAGNRQGFPVGAAYLRDASDLLRTKIIPAAASLATVNARQLNSSESAASAPADVVLVVVTGLLLFAALFAVQQFLVRRTHRAINVGLGLASIASLGFVIAVLAVFSAERSAVVSADSHGYAAAATLARARALVFQAQADESQALIAQGNGQSYLADFTAASGQVGPLLDLAASAAPTSVVADDVGRAKAAFAAFLAVHQAIVRCDNAGQHASAVALALKPASVVPACGGSVPTPAGNGSFDESIRGGIDAGEASFTAEAAAARKDVQRLPVIMTVAAIAAGLLAFAGAQQRINEYR